MTLPDASHLLDWPAERWRALGERLSAIELTQAHRAVSAIGGDQAFEPAVRPLRQWHLRRGEGPAFIAIRMLMYGDPVSEAEAREALGDIGLDELLAVGLLQRATGEPARLGSPFVLRFCDSLFLLGDDLTHGGDAVMSLGRMTVDLARAALPAGRIERALDLGCGAGTCALVLAARAEHVVGVDINPRAITLSRVNQAINGIPNADFRCGDLYQPVAGESFDLVASQPPFVARPDGRDEATYLFGGRRGDELPLRALAGAPAHLRPGGRAVMLVQWLTADEEAVATRVRRAVDPEGVDVLVIDAPGPDIDSLCMADAALNHAGFGPDYARKVFEDREHMARLGALAVRETLTVLVRREALESAPSFTATFAAPELNALKLRGEQVEDLIRAHTLAAGEVEGVLASRLRLPAGSRVERNGNRFRLLYPEGYLLDGIELDKGAYRVVTHLQESATVRHAARAFAAKARLPPSRALDEFVPAVLRVLRAGVVRIA